MVIIYGKSDCTEKLLREINHYINMPLFTIPELPAPKQIQDFWELKKIYEKNEEMKQVKKRKYEMFLKALIRDKEGNLRKKLHQLIKAKKMAKKNLKKDIRTKENALKRWQNVFFAEKKRTQPRILRKFRSMIEIIKTTISILFNKIMFKKRLHKPFHHRAQALANNKQELDFLRENQIEILGDSLRKFDIVNQIIDLKKHLYFGAIGEESVIRSLQELPDRYILINDFYFSFPKAIYWKKGRQYIRSVQIDHVVLGPTGIFLIETKNWKKKRFEETEFDPYSQITRASIGLFILGKKELKKKLPTRKIICTNAKVPDWLFRRIEGDFYCALKRTNNIFDYIMYKEKILSLEMLKYYIKWFLDVKNHPLRRSRSHLNLSRRLNL